MLLEFICRPQYLCDSILLKCNFKEFSFLLPRYHCVVNVAEGLYYI